MDNRIEEVKKILTDFRLELQERHYDFHHDAQLEAEELICQLFPQPLDDEELREKMDKILKSECKAQIGCPYNFDCEKHPDCFARELDQILALLSKEYMSKEECEECQAQTECKIREERERIGKQLGRELDLAPRGMRIPVIEQCIEDLEKGQALKGGG